MLVVEQPSLATASVVSRPIEQDHGLKEIDVCYARIMFPRASKQISMLWPLLILHYSVMFCNLIRGFETIKLCHQFCSARR